MELERYPDILSNIEDVIMRRAIKALFVVMTQACLKTGGTPTIDMTIFPTGNAAVYTHGFKAKVDTSVFKAIWDVGGRFPGYIDSIMYYNPRHSLDEQQAKDLNFQNALSVQVNSRAHLVDTEARVKRTKEAKVPSELDSRGERVVAAFKDKRDGRVASYVMRTLSTIENLSRVCRGIDIDEDNRDVIRLIFRTWTGGFNSHLISILSRANSSEMFDYDPIKDIHLVIPSDESEEKYDLVVTINRRQNTVVRYQHLTANQPPIAAVPQRGVKRSLTSFEDVDLSDQPAPKITRVV